MEPAIDIFRILFHNIKLASLGISLTKEDDVDNFIEQIKHASSVREFIDTVIRRTFNFQWLLSYEYLVGIKKELDLKLKESEALSKDEKALVIDFVNKLRFFACYYTAQDIGKETERKRILTELFYIKRNHTRDFDYDPTQKCLIFTGKPIPPVEMRLVTEWAYYWPLPD